MLNIAEISGMMVAPHARVSVWAIDQEVIADLHPRSNIVKSGTVDHGCPDRFRAMQPAPHTAPLPHAAPGSIG